MSNLEKIDIYFGSKDVDNSMYILRLQVCECFFKSCMMEVLVLRGPWCCHNQSCSDVCL